MKIPMSLFQEKYIPIIPDGQLYLTVLHSWRTLPVTRSTDPQQILGSAQRVGYTGSQPDDLAIYRLRIIHRYRSVMLPGFFVFRDGVFVSYEDGHEIDELL
jgi:hypothetical protein